MMNKSSRHPKIAGEFGEALLLYWLSKSGFETSRIDHTGIDLVAFHKKSGKRLGISVKCRTRIEGTESEGIYLKNAEIKKIKDACGFFGCGEQYLGIVTDRGSKIDLILMSLDDAKKINGKGKTYINIKVTPEYIRKYRALSDALVVHMAYEEESSFRGH